MLMPQKPEDVRARIPVMRHRLKGAKEGRVPLERLIVIVHKEWEQHGGPESRKTSATVDQLGCQNEQ